MFPFMVHSYHAKFLTIDLDELSLMHMEVVQTMPLSMIDVSLLFGIPLVVRAGLETDYAQFQDMKVLVRSFFTVLQRQQKAILLRGSKQFRLEKSTVSNEHVHAGFSYPAEQYFLLMSQETPTAMINTESVSAGPSSGLLFRIAHFDYLLHDKSMTERVHDQYITDGDCETEIQYMEYIENSLSTLSFSMYNPFTISIPNNGLHDEPIGKTFENIGDEGNTHTSLCILEAEDAPLPMKESVSISTDPIVNEVSIEMDLSYEAENLSIYDFHAVTDDMPN